MLYNVCVRRGDVLTPPRRTVIYDMCTCDAVKNNLRCCCTIDLKSNLKTNLSVCVIDTFSACLYHENR